MPDITQLARSRGRAFQFGPPDSKAATEMGAWWATPVENASDCIWRMSLLELLTSTALEPCSEGWGSHSNSGLEAIYPGCWEQFASVRQVWEKS